jgi:proteic killer suppression protein
MIVSFACRDTEKLFSNLFVKRFSGIEKAARVKLKLLNAVTSLEDLRSPPGNRLEGLSGNRDGQYSIRINQQWRICFFWKQNNAHAVEIVDYH